MEQNNLHDANWFKKKKKRKRNISVSKKGIRQTNQISVKTLTRHVAVGKYLIS